MSPFARLLLEPSIKQLIEHFKNTTKYESQFQFQLAKYQFEQKHYAAAALCLAEAMVSLVAECEGLNNNNRQLAKNVIMSTELPEKMKNYSKFYRFYLLEKKNVTEDAVEDHSKDIQKKYRKTFIDLSNIRNGVAHILSKNTSLDDAKDCIKNALDFVSPLVSFDKR